MTQPANIHDPKRHDPNRLEPSMEDILASIRRIVADDDISADVAATDTRPASVSLSASDDKPPTVAAFPAEKTSATGSVEAGGNLLGRTTVMDRRADIDALLAELEASEAGFPAEAGGTPKDHKIPDPEIVADGTDEIGAQDTLLPDNDEIASQSDDLERDILELTEEMAKRERWPAPNAMPVAAAQQAPEDEEAIQSAPGEAGDATLTQPMLSQATAAAVESAFNSLASTVLGDNARTLEGLVREMLRPMLKSWLDDNLPGIVERVVRAEIERVSRGR